MKQKNNFLDQMKMRQIETLAQETLDQCGISIYPIDPKTICKFHDIEVKPKPTSSKGVSGMLLRYGNNYGIMYAQHITSIGFQRFSISHEIGHYKIPGHPEAVLGENNIHESSAGFISDQKFEKEADYFAANLLMPQQLFKQEMENNDVGLSAIKILSDKFQTSLISTAIRYTDLTEDPIVVIITNHGKVEWCSMSSAFKEADGIEWLKKNDPIPQNSITHNILTKEIKDHEDGYISLQEWFNGASDIEVTEAAIRIGKTDKILTLIYDINFSNEEDSDEYYQELWSPKYK